MNKQLIEDLNLLSDRKLELFNKLLDITVSQRNDIENNKADNIEALVQSKQQIIDKIDQLDKGFLAGYQRLRTELNLDKADKINIERYPELASLKSRVEGIMTLGQRIMELENSNKEKLDQVFNQVKNELRQIKAGKRSLKAYEPVPTYNDGMFIDKKK